MGSENQDIRKMDLITDIVECTSSLIYGDYPTDTINFFKSLPFTPCFNYQRVLAVPYLFQSFENIVLSDEEPIPGFRENFQDSKTSPKII